MTTPKMAKKKSSYGPRMYAWPPGAEDPEFEVISVTSAIGNGYPKPFLIPWASKVSAECAVEDHEIIGAMLKKGDERAAIDHVKNARNRIMNAKADRGTIVHSALEAYVLGQPIDNPQLAAKLEDARVPRGLWKSTAGMIDGVLKFLKDEEPEITHSERTVFSRTHGYAGTADLIGRMKVGDSLVPVVIDIKTGKSIYDDTAMQLCAYARADFVGEDDGTEAEIMGEPIEYGIVVRPMASGTYEKVVFTLNDDVFDLFLNCLAVASAGSVLHQSRRP
jgi:hypothetical protein